jgi:hypothetical protein
MAYFFPRGNGPLVSVLLPTRGRRDHRRQAIDSCHGTAHDPSLLEFLLKVDDDDAETLAVLPDLVRKYGPCLEVMVSPRGNRYLDFHRWINELAESSTGDWLLLWNDDARMLTPAWEQTILNLVAWSGRLGITDCCLLALCDADKKTPCTSFPILRRKAFEVLGHYSRSPLVDIWISSVMQMLDATFTLPAEMRHVRHEVIADEGVVPSDVDKHNALFWSLRSVESLRAMLDDADKLVRHLERLRAKQVWLLRPREGGGWHYWREAPGSAEITFFVSENRRVATIVSGGEEPKHLDVAKQGGVWCKL